MAERNPPAWLQGGSHPADLDRLMLETLIPTGGVVDLAGGHLAVTEQGTPAMGVTVAAGRAVIAGTEASAQGVYHAVNDADTDLAVSASDPTNPRVDLVVARVRDAFYSGATDAWALEIVTGTAAATPSEPATPDNALVLARIDVPASASSITDANITDRREQARASLDLVRPPSIVKYRSTVNQTLADSTVTTIVLDQEIAGSRDPLGAFTLNTSTGVVTINKTGWYDIRAELLYGSNSTGRRLITVALNGSANLLRSDPGASDSSGRSPNGSCLHYLTAGNTIEIQGFQNSGINLLVLAGTGTRLDLMYLG